MYKFYYCHLFFDHYDHTSNMAMNSLTTIITTTLTITLTQQLLLFT